MAQTIELGIDDLVRNNDHSKEVDQPATTSSLASGLEWNPYADSWVESPLWGWLFIKFPKEHFGECGKRLPKAFFGLRWMLLSPFRIRLRVPLGEWSLGELLMAVLIVSITIAAGIATWGAENPSGHVAVIPCALTFMLASRNSIWTLILGLPFERAIWWHQLTAWMAVVLGLSHGLTAGGNTTGFICEGSMAALCVLGIPCLRRKFWEFFLRTHWILFTAAGLAGVYHCAWESDGSAMNIGWGILLWAIDICCRFFFMAYYRYPKECKIEKLPADVIKLSFPSQGSNFTYKAGQYLFICIPDISAFEWHPFSISSAPHESDITVHVRVLGDWTKQLHTLASKKTGQTVRMFMEGPFGAPAIDLDSDEYKHFILLSGGIGITPMQAITNDLLYQHKELGRPLEKVWFLWSCRDHFMVDAVLHFDKNAHQAKAARRLPHSFCPDLLTHTGRSGKDIFSGSDSQNTPSVSNQDSAIEAHDDVLIADFFLTKAQSDDQQSYANIKPELLPQLNFGRPNIKVVFERMETMVCESSSANEEEGIVAVKRRRKKLKKVAVCVCGPESMMKDTYKECLDWSARGKVQFDYHGEVFAL